MNWPELYLSGCSTQGILGEVGSPRIIPNRSESRKLAPVHPAFYT